MGLRKFSPRAWIPLHEKHSSVVYIRNPFRRRGNKSEHVRLEHRSRAGAANGDAVGS